MDIMAKKHLKKAESRCIMKISYDYSSFMRQTGNESISEGLESAIEQFVDQLEKQPALGDVTFKHVDYDGHIVYLRRNDMGYLVSLEGKDFSIEA